jgi:MFS family permease
LVLFNITTFLLSLPRKVQFLLFYDLTSFITKKDSITGAPKKMPPPGKAGNGPPVTWMSLPHKPQLFLLALCRLSEPLSNTCLLPYIYYLIRSLHPSSNPTPAAISRQAGLLVSLFALSQFATSLPWASIANRWGRKPSVTIGLVLSIVSNLGFGFSKSIPALMCWRVLAGIGNGNIGVMRTMTAEIVVERKYQSRAFLLLPLVFNSGNVVGLAVGGWLADPVTNLPSLFGQNGILNFGHTEGGVAWMREYPFALPTIFNAFVLFSSLLLAFFGLRETMPGATHHRDLGLKMKDSFIRIVRRIFRGRAAEYTSLAQTPSTDSELDLLSKTPTSTTIISASNAPPKLSITSREIYTREVLLTIISFALLPLHNSAFMNLFPVFLSTPPSPNTPTTPLSFTGGLGLPSPTIGLYLSAFAIYGILIQLFLYPPLQSHLGTLGIYRLALALFPLTYLLAPYLSLLPSKTIISGICIAGILWSQVTARTFGIPSSVILLTNSAARKEHLGAVHGVGNMANALARAVGPAVGGVVYGWGVEGGCVGLVWWVWLGTVCLVGLAWSFTLTEGEHPAAKKPPPRIVVQDVESEGGMERYRDLASPGGSSLGEGSRERSDEKGGEDRRG